MLKKINRLTKNKEFDNVFNPPAGKRVKSSYDKITGVKAVINELDHNRFGILVGAKVSKKAVIRNKIKRRVREIIRLQADKMKQGYDCVIICLPEIADKNYQEIEESVSGHLKKLKLYK
jgi:ribonuclease P protein component